MTREEVEARLKEAIAQHFSSDGDRIGVAIGAPPEGFGLSDHPSVHNFMVSIQIPLKE